MARVQAKVANVLGMNRFALNKGASEGVEKGHIVDVIKIIEITDPDTNEKLGESPAIVAQLQIVAVEERFAIAGAVKGDQVLAMGQTSVQVAESISRSDEVSINIG